MALSDDERRVLDEMERQLRASSNDVVELGTRRRINATAVTVGILVIVAGIGVLLGGIIYRVPLVGVLGFGAMVIGVLVATSRRGSNDSPSPRSTRPSSGGSGRKSTFEDRWERRMGGDL